MSKISAYGAYASPQANALLPIVDVNDHTMSSTGTTKNITLGALGLPVISILNPAYGGGADPTGTNDSTAAIQAALNAVPSTGAVVVIPAGTYKTTSTLNIIKPLTFVQGAGQRISTIKYYGTGDCIYMHADNYTDFSNFLFSGGGIKGITVDGTNSTGVATGLNFGDWYACEFDMHVLKFTSVGSYGVRFFNSMGFTEKTRGYFAIQQSDTCFTFDVSTTTSTANRSFGYTDLTIEMDGMTGNGIVVQNGAQVYHSRIAARANVSAGVGSSYACIVVKGKCAAGIQNPGSASQIVASRLDFQAEANSATNVQQTVNIDLSNNCRITNCTGIMDFNFNAQMALSNVSQTGAGSTYFQYSGVVSGDTNLNPGGAGSGFVTVGPRLYSKGRVDASSGTIYAALGDFFQFTLSANVTISLTGYNPNVAGPQRKTIIIQQASSGGPYTVTWPTSGSPTTSSPNVVWTSGVTPAQTVTAGGVNVYQLITYDGATWYGQALTQDSTTILRPSGDVTGATDAAVLINAASSSNKQWTLAPGTWYFGGSAPALLASGTSFNGSGEATVITIVSGFTGSSVFAANGDGSGVSNLSIVGASSTITSNPQCNAIENQGFQRFKVDNVFCQYVNGWALEWAGTASRGTLDSMLRRFTARNCAGGVHLLGVTGSSFSGETFASDIQLQRIGGGTTTLDAFLVEDCQDVLVSNYNGSVLGSAGTGTTLHVKGACSSVYFTNTDIGMITRGTASSTLHVESGTNGSPSGCGFNGGVVQAGNIGILVDAGTNIGFHSLTVKNNTTDNVQVNGGDQIVFDAGCNFATGNQGGTTANDVHLTNSSGFVYVKGCIFASPVNTTPTAGNVTNPVNDVNHRGIFESCAFVGSGNTPSTVFSGTPQIVRNCTGYNPRGSITAPTIGTSPATISTSQQDTLIIFTAINGMTAFAIGGTTVPVPPVNVPFRVPARQSVTVTYTTTAPTWQWIAD